jgi:hypothetical protein
VEIVNTALAGHTSLTVVAQLYKADGSVLWEKREPAPIQGNEVKKCFAIPKPEGIEGVYFLKLALWEKEQCLTTNIYWLPTTPKEYTGLTRLPQTKPTIQATLHPNGGEYTGTVRLGAGKNISFFNRIKVFDKATGKRILPVHYSDNYITLMPGDEQTVTLQFSTSVPREQIEIAIDSWTSERIVTRASNN